MTMIGKTLKNINKYKITKHITIPVHKQNASEMLKCKFHSLNNTRIFVFQTKTKVQTNLKLC